MVTRYIEMYFFYIVLVLVVQFVKDISARKVVYAVNCGGEEHTDYYEIHYLKDPLDGVIGTPSDFGKRLLIGRVRPEDQILYQTERYHTSNFGYNIPIKEDADYILVLKFSEVYFNDIDRKIFSVKLNSRHTVISDLDIFKKVGRGVAHDEHIRFKVAKGYLYINGDKSALKDGNMYLEFERKPDYDNPKINAFYVLKGTLDDVPRLPQIEMELPEEEFKEVEPEDDSKRDRRPSGPALPDPYLLDDSSMMLPIFIAIAAFIPILFCLCKL